MTHDTPWVIAGHSNASLKGYGGWGVNLFFVISGVLICTRILADEKYLGTFHLKAFYVRRFFRIQPAALVYLCAIGILITTGVVGEQWHYWLGALFMYQNYLYRALEPQQIGFGFFTGHFWTLGVEEQFYIILSLFLYLAKRYRASLMAILLLALFVTQRILLTAGLFDPNTSTRQTLWQIEFLLVPAAFALLLDRQSVKVLAIRFLHPWVSFVITAILLTVNYLTAHSLGPQSNLLFYCFSLWVIGSMLHPLSLTTRILEIKPLRFIGRLSYSIYLWHVLFFANSAPVAVISSGPLVFLSARPQKYLATFALALASYYFIEKPLIRIGHRLAPPATPGHKDLLVVQSSSQ